MKDANEIILELDEDERVQQVDYRRSRCMFRRRAVLVSFSYSFEVVYSIFYNLVHNFYFSTNYLFIDYRRSSIYMHFEN
jgi:hypothetical protein